MWHWIGLIIFTFTVYNIGRAFGDEHGYHRGYTQAKRIFKRD